VTSTDASNSGKPDSPQLSDNSCADEPLFDELVDPRVLDELTDYRYFDELTDTRLFDELTDPCVVGTFFASAETLGPRLQCQGDSDSDPIGSDQYSQVGTPTKCVLPQANPAVGRSTNLATLIASRLVRCGKCDQLVGRTCTMTGLDAVTLAGEITGRCPQGLWPGEVPRKWLKTTVQEAVPRSKVKQSALLLFPHGFGDHVQLISVLRHMELYRSELTIDLVCRAGCESLYRDLCAEVFSFGDLPRKAYDRIVPLWWREPVETYNDSPSTKAERCLREVFRMVPVAKHCHYQCAISPADVDIASSYLRRIGAAGRAVLIHNQGRCGRDLKDLPREAVLGAITAIREAGCVPLMLDWDQPSEFSRDGLALSTGADEELWPNGFGDAGRLAALANLSRLCIGIDSGPGHLFGAVPTPTLLYWKYLHPVNYYGLSQNVIHLVPRSHGRFIRGDRVRGEAYFESAYTFRQYVQIEQLLPALIRERLGSARHTCG